MICPTCTRHGSVCDYCRTLCASSEPRTNPCDCACHVADVDRETTQTQAIGTRLVEAFKA